MLSKQWPTYREQPVGSWEREGQIIGSLWHKEEIIELWNWRSMQQWKNEARHLYDMQLQRDEACIRFCTTICDASIYYVTACHSCDATAVLCSSCNTHGVMNQCNSPVVMHKLGLCNVKAEAGKGTGSPWRFNIVSWQVLLDAVHDCEHDVNMMWTCEHDVNMNCSLYLSLYKCHINHTTQSHPLFWCFVRFSHFTII